MTTFSFEAECVRGRVLLIEDASVFREMQSLLLRRAGYAVVTCDQPHLALHEAAHQPFDVALLNSDAPGLDTPEFFDALRRHRPKMAIIFVAAALTLELTRELTRAGAATVLQRPVNPALLMEKIDFAVGHALRPAAPQFFDAAAESLATRKAAAVVVATDSTPPFSTGSTPPFLTQNSNSPFPTNNSASPFSSSSSTPPFGSDSAAPFTVRAGSTYSKTAVR